MFVVQFAGKVEANFLPIPTPQPAFVIQADGSISSLMAPIQRDGDVYLLMDDIRGYTISVERDNVILDGNGYLLQGNGNSTGVFIKNRNNVTVRNMQISGFSKGIHLFSDVFAQVSGHHFVYGNNITNNQWGTYLQHSTNNMFRDNQLNNTGSIFVTYSPVLSDIPSFFNDIDSSNTVNGKPIIYWVNQHNRTVPQGVGQVSLINCTNIKVQNLNLTHNSRGVMLVYTNYSTITQNTITNSVDHGIYVYKSLGNNITKNKIKNSATGICFWHSSRNSVTDNILDSNSQNCIYFFNSSNNNVTRNTIKSNNQGIYIYSHSTNNTIFENTIAENTEHGVTVSWSSTTTISNNIIERNGNGILIEDSPNNKIVGNLIKENIGWGIQLEDGQINNTIYHNYFVHNNLKIGMQVSIPGLWNPDSWDPGNPNVWDDGKKGNYWSDYQTRYPNATEIDATGIGDTPFYINPNNIDRCPIMDIETIPEFSSFASMLLAFVLFFVSLVIYRRKVSEKR